MATILNKSANVTAAATTQSTRIGFLKRSDCPEWLRITIVPIAKVIKLNPPRKIT